MAWKRSTPLWPFACVLTVLLVLAFDAPRNWQPSGPHLASVNTDRMSVPEVWANPLTPPAQRNLRSYSSPVVEPELPSVAEPNLTFPETIDLSGPIPSAANLPRRSEFNLGTLLEIRNSLQDLLGQLPELESVATSDGSRQASSSAHVLVTSPQDRLAMRNPLQRSSQIEVPPAIDNQQRLEAFADELMESVRRSRLGLKPPIKVAMKPGPVVLEANPADLADSSSDLVWQPGEVPSSAAVATEHLPSMQVAMPDSGASPVTPTEQSPLDVTPITPTEHPKIELRSLQPIVQPHIENFQMWGAQLAEQTRVAMATSRKLASRASDLLPAPISPVTPTAEPVVDVTPTLRFRKPVVEAKTKRVEAEREAVHTPPALPLLRFYPQALVQRLEAVPADSPAADWSNDTLQLVRRLAKDTSTQAEEAAEIVEKLRHQVNSGREQADELADYALRQHWLRLVSALDCRTVIWQGLFDPRMNTISDGLQSSAATDALIVPVLNDIVALVEGDHNGQRWRDYLLLDQVAAASSAGASSDIRGRRKLAQEVLSRMSDTRLSEAQRRFVDTPPVANLRECVKPWASGPVDMETVAALVERYDADPGMRYAAAISQLKQRLQWSPTLEYQQLAEHLDRHFRGANMRVALSEDLLTRLLPQESPRYSPVNDHIAGSKVKGRSRTTAKLSTNMIPNDKAWQISLEAKGAVYSKTRSDTWPASVNNAAKLFYDARKTILIDSNGMRVAPTRATARGRNELVGIDTEFDPIPLLSHLARDVARRKHHQSRSIAMRQAKNKVTKQAKQQMDQGVGRKLNELQQRFDNNILGSMEQLALSAEPVEMYTTSQRAVMLLRLANSLQLASTSLRPLAPSDSLASVQLHESALNNAAAGLKLEGRRMTVLQLHHFISARMGRPGEPPADDLPLGAKVEFAPYNAIRINCQGDQLEVVLRIKEVSRGIDKIRNFAVHAFFQPEVDGLDVRLVRDGTLHFEGRQLRMGPRIVLHSVFNKLLRKDQEVQLVKQNVASDPRLAGLMVTQLVIDDGWIGLALGPRFDGRTAWRTLPHVVR